MTTRRGRRVLWLSVLAVIALQGLIIATFWCPTLRDLESHGIPALEGPFPFVKGPARCWLIFAEYAGSAVAIGVGVELFGLLYQRWPRILTNLVLIASLILTSLGAPGRPILLAAGLSALIFWL